MIARYRVAAGTTCEIPLDASAHQGENRCARSAISSPHRPPKRVAPIDRHGPQHRCSTRLVPSLQLLIRSPISVGVLFSVGARNHPQRQEPLLELESRESTSLVKLAFPVIILGRKANVVNGVKLVQEHKLRFDFRGKLLVRHGTHSAINHITFPSQPFHHCRSKDGASRPSHRV